MDLSDICVITNSEREAMGLNVSKEYVCEGLKGWKEKGKCVIF